MRAEIPATGAAFHRRYVGAQTVIGLTAAALVSFYLKALVRLTPDQWVAFLWWVAAYAVLATIANIAPLLGFLGTVVGMILSFDVIAQQGLNDPGAVAKGISVALLTTAYGLIVAFFTQPFYNFFTSKVAAYTRQIETAANILFETFDEMEERGATAQQTAAV